MKILAVLCVRILGCCEVGNDGSRLDLCIIIGQP